MQDTLEKPRRLTAADYKAESAEILEGIRRLNEQIEADRQVSLRLKQETDLLKARTRAKLREMGRVI